MKIDCRMKNRKFLADMGLIFINPRETKQESQKIKNDFNKFKSRVGYLLLAISCIISFSMFTGCQSTPLNNTSNSDSSNVLDDGKYTIVTSFYPIYISVINITQGVDTIEVVNMTPAQTGCLHDYQLKPQDIKILETADAFVINGAGMESFMDDIIKQQPDLKIIEASTGIELLNDQSGEQNPHLWVSITNAMKQVSNITNGLALLDPKNAIVYKKNSSIYLSKLNALRDKATNDLSSLKTRDIVTFHEAFPYFAKEFNLNILAVIEREPDTTPTAKELEAIIKIINDSKTKVIFAEPQYSNKSAQMIADATGAKVYTLDPIVTGESNTNAINNYITTMEKNIATLKEALG